MVLYLLPPLALGRAVVPLVFSSAGDSLDAYSLQRQGVPHGRYKPEVLSVVVLKFPSFLEELGFNLKLNHTMQANIKCLVHSLGDFA